MARPIDDPYRTLGILRGAEPDEIRAAHRRLAKRFHPDGSMGDEQRFLAVQEAYQLLSDPLRRRDWDHRHAAGPMPANGRAGPSHDDPPHAEPPHAVGPDDRSSDAEATDSPRAAATGARCAHQDLVGRAHPLVARLQSACRARRRACRPVV